MRGAARAGALENGGEEKSMNKDPKKPKDPSASDREKELDEAIEESFPASDPPAIAPTFAGAPSDRAAELRPAKDGSEKSRKK